MQLLCTRIVSAIDETFEWKMWHDIPVTQIVYDYEYFEYQNVICKTITIY